MTKSAPAFSFNTDSALCVGSTRLADIVKDKDVGTPCYIYSQPAIIQAVDSWRRAFPTPHKLCYSVKANSNFAILKLMNDAGWGFDIISGGELARLRHRYLALSTDGVRFSGPGKTVEEMDLAILANIDSLNIESFAEAQLLEAAAAKRACEVRVAVRVNPGIKAGARAEISTASSTAKFGVPLDDAEDVYDFLAASKYLKPCGIAYHLGSQIDTVEPWVSATEKLLPLLDNLRKKGLNIEELDIGGGAAIEDDDINALPPEDLAQAMLPLAEKHSLKLVLSPGRSVVGRAGVLVTKVLYSKEMDGRNVLVVDAAMNDYMRPALYDVQPNVLPLTSEGSGATEVYDLVGPVCESTDCLSRDLSLDADVGTLLALMDAGAYGMSMSSNYNSRLRPPEVLVSEGECRLIRYRETHDDLFAHEINQSLAPTLSFDELRIAAQKAS